MEFNRKVPFILLVLAIIIKLSWFYNKVSVTSNFLIIVCMTSIFYGGLVLLFTRKPLISIFFALLFTFIFEAEVLYFRYFNRLLSFYNFTQVRFVNSVSNVMFSLVRWTDVILLIDIIVLVVILLLDKELLHIKKKSKIITMVFLLVLAPSISLATYGSDLGVSIFNQEFFMYHIRDGIEVYTNEEEAVGETIPVEVPEKFIGEEVIQKNNEGIFKGKNIITIQVESLQDMVILKDYNGQEITPFLNKLIRGNSFYFSSYYQQLGKGNTSDAEFSTHNSIFPSMEGISYMRYRDFNFRGLPVLLKEKGYSTYAFHGNEAAFWFRGEAYENQGLDNFYSEEKLENDEILGMGLSDKSLFRQGAEILDSVEGPFYGFFITLTNHNPYIIPEEQITIGIAEEDKEELFGRYIESVKYTDEAIESFYNDLKDRGLLDNTVFVVYGDHHGIVKMDLKYQKRVSEFLGFEYDFDEMMNIPLIINAPGTEISGIFDVSSDQQDFLPTMTNLLGIDDSEVFMVGQDLFNTEDFFTVFQTYMVSGSFIEGDVIFEMSRDGIFEHSRAWNIKTKEVVPIEECLEGYKRALHELDYSRYIVENNKVLDWKE